MRCTLIPHVLMLKAHRMNIKSIMPTTHHRIAVVTIWRRYGLQGLATMARMDQKIRRGSI